MSNFKQFFDKLNNNPDGSSPYEIPVNIMTSIFGQLGLPDGFTQPSTNHNIIVNTDSGIMYALYNSTTVRTGYDSNWPANSTDGGVVLSDLLVSDQSLQNNARQEFETLPNDAALYYLIDAATSTLLSGEPSATNVILLLNKNANDMDINATELTLFAGGDSSKNIKIIDRVDNESDSTKKEWMIGTNGVDRFGTGNDSNAKNVHVEFKQGFVSGNNNVYVRDGYNVSPLYTRTNSGFMPTSEYISEEVITAALDAWKLTSEAQDAINNDGINIDAVQWANVMGIIVNAWTEENAPWSENVGYDVDIDTTHYVKVDIQFNYNTVINDDITLYEIINLYGEAPNYRIQNIGSSVPNEYHLKNKIDTLVNDYTTMHQGLNADYSVAGSRYEKIQSAIDNTLFADYDRTFIKMREQFDEEIASNNLAMIATTIDSVSGNSNANTDALVDLESSSNALKLKTDTIGTKTNPSSEPLNNDSVETLLQWSRCFVPQPVNYNSSIVTMITALNNITGVGTGSDTGTVETLINLRHNRQRLDKQLLSLKSAVHTSRVVMKSSGDNFSNELTNIIKEVNTFVQNSMSAFEGEVVRKQIALQNMMEDLSSLQAKLYFSQQQYKQSATELNHFYSWYVNTNGLQ